MTRLSSDLPATITASQRARIARAAPLVVDAILDAVDAIENGDGDGPAVAERLKIIAVVAASWIVLREDGAVDGVEDGEGDPWDHLRRYG